MKATAASFWVLVFALSCRDTPPQPTSATIDLAAIDASCTDAWLRVTLQNVSPPQTVAFRRDDQIVQTIQLTTTDSTVVDTGLVPRRTYLYKAFRFGNNTPIDSSTPISITTLDTTTHNFTWQIDTLGDGNSSVLYDVAIINDTLAYAVGEIYKRDSLGNWDPQPYNIARWNGTVWTIVKVPYYSQGQPFYSPIRAVFAFGANDIWFGIGNLIHWNGQSFVSVSLPSNVWGAYRINKIWGQAAEIWIVGDGGSIAHKSASGTWRRVESGTTMSVYDVFGARNSINGELEVLAVASNVFLNEGAKLFRLEGNNVVALADSGLTWGVNGLWFSPEKRYYVVGPGIHQKRSLGDPLWKVYAPGEVTSYFSGAVRGSAVNDVFVVGSFREVVHFNGINWHRYSELEPGSSGSFGAVAVNGNLMIAVGGVSPRALALIGRRM